MIDASHKCIVVGTTSRRCSPRGVEVNDDWYIATFERNVQFSLCDLLRLQNEAHNTSGNQRCYIRLCDCGKLGSLDRTTTMRVR
jgi:hypothetical protein